MEVLEGFLDNEFYSICSPWVFVEISKKLERKNSQACSSANCLSQWIRKADMAVASQDDAIAKSDPLLGKGCTAL